MLVYRTFIVKIFLDGTDLNEIQSKYTDEYKENKIIFDRMVTKYN